MVAAALAYDDNGNRTMGGYVVGVNNRILSDGTYSYEYDDEGNQTAKETIATGERVEYTWDYRNRLTTITTKDALGVVTKSVEQSYDVFNQWVRGQVDTDGDPDFDSERFFLYDDGQIVLEFDGGTASDLSHRYLWGEAVDQLFADEQVASPSSAGDVIWPVSDHLGTPRDLLVYDSGTNTTSNANHRTYDSFGNLVSETNGTVTILIGFTGCPFDKNIGLNNHLYRWYDPATGTWKSEDPIGFEARDANLGRYVSNSPTFLVDPIGQEGKPWWDATRPGGINDTLNIPFRWLWNIAMASATPNEDFYLKERYDSCLPGPEDVALPDLRDKAIIDYHRGEDAKRAAKLQRTPEGQAQLDREFARRRLARMTGEVITSTVPLWSDYRDGREVITGKDLHTGEELSYDDRHTTVLCSSLPAISGKHARRVNDFAQGLQRLAKREFAEYLDDVARFGRNRELGDAQRELLEQFRKNNSLKYAGPQVAASSRKEFAKNKSRLIAEWEKNTGRSWPKYKNDVPSQSGGVHRQAGSYYDAHEIIPNSYGGPQEWWNIHPASSPAQHQGGIHRSGGIFRQLFPMD